VEEALSLDETINLDEGELSRYSSLEYVMQKIEDTKIQIKDSIATFIIERN